MRKITINNHTVYIGTDYAVVEHNTLIDRSEKNELSRLIRDAYCNVMSIFYRHKKDKSQAWKTIID